MSEDPYPIHVIMAVENAVIRNALLSAIAPLPCSPEIVQPEALLQAELSGANLIFLETSNDVERLISTVQQLWCRWGETDRAGVWFLSYSTEEVTPDSVVFRLWSIGPEMTVIVQVWRPNKLSELRKDAYRFIRHVLEAQADTTPEP